MTDWVKASNPTAPITTEVEATAAARASAIAIFLGVLWAIWGVIYLATDGAAMIEAAQAQAVAQNPEAEGMGGIVTSLAWGGAIAAVVIQVVLGLVQWFKPNVIIPIIFTILIVYGLGSTLMLLMNADGAAGMGPMWQVVVGIVIMIIELILHISGIRGASALSKFREA